MLTDDDLVRELEAGFRAETGSLRYTGRVPTPRRSAVPWSVLPVAAAAAAIMVAPHVLGGEAPGGPSSVPPPPTATTSGPTVTTAAPRMVTSKVRLAGFTFTVRHAAGEPLPVYFDLVPGGLPDGVKPVDIDPPVRAWTGTDPGSGDSAVYIDAPTRNGGELFAMFSSSWSTDQLVDLLLHGDPFTSGTKAP